MTGFSWEGFGCHTANLAVFMQASSRLKPVLQESAAFIQWNLPCLHCRFPWQNC